MLFRQFSETVLYSDHFQMNLKKNDCKVQMVFSYSHNFRCTMLAHLPKLQFFQKFLMALNGIQYVFGCNSEEKPPVVNIIKLWDWE